MSLPNFLVIGASRSGSTWLDNHLRGHKKIFMPHIRKEINLFNLYYHRDLSWYEQFFPSNKDASFYQAIGESSPGYLSSPDAPKRIKELLPGCKFIVILRDPVIRVYSQWKYRVQKRFEKRSFAEYFKTEQEPYDLSCYGKHLSHYYKYFEPTQFLVLIFEKVIGDPAFLFNNLSRFLSVDQNLFKSEMFSAKINYSYIPKFPRAYNFAFKIKQLMRKSNMDKIVNIAKRAGIENLFGHSSKRFPKLPKDVHERLLSHFSDDISLLETLISQDIKEWKLL